MKKPVFLIFFLILILIFILGVRYGQSIERNNKIIDYILSITPYPTYTPYPSPTKIASASPTLKMPPRVIPSSPTVFPSEVEKSQL